LARVSRLFRQEAIRSALRKAQTAEDVLNVLVARQADDAA
jgi:mannitol/fructose-specific phosphotransferase system IIA component (Ntr-type)